MVAEALSDADCRRRLVESIKSLTIDVKLLQLVLMFGYGRPAQAVELTKTVTLEQIVAGTVNDEDEDGIAAAFAVEALTEEDKDDSVH